MDDMIQLRDTFREASDILDELISIKTKENAGEDIEKECEAILGRFIITMTKLENLKGSM